MSVFKDMLNKNKLKNYKELKRLEKLKKRKKEKIILCFHACLYKFSFENISYSLGKERCETCRFDAPRGKPEWIPCS